MAERRTHERYFKKDEGDITGKQLLLRKKEDNPNVFLAVLAHELFKGGEYLIGKEIPQIKETSYIIETINPDKQVSGTTTPISDETRYVVGLKLLSGTLKGSLELEIDNRNLDKKTHKKNDRYTLLCVTTEYIDYRIILKNTGQNVEIYKQNKDKHTEFHESFFIGSENSISEVQKYLGELLNQPSY